MYIKKIYALVLLFFFLSQTFLNASEKIAFIDVDYVLNNSNYGKIILKQLETVNNENIKKLSEKEKIIIQKKDSINKKKKYFYKRTA